MVEDDLFKTLTAQERGTLYTLLARAVAALSPEHDTGEHDTGKCAADAPDRC